ncbi:GTPase Era [Candidatus Sumerlaeota bacterium]|nr:GTPase Era [Candidatus Sumerlaeota bacterium]
MNDFLETCNPEHRSGYIAVMGKPNVGKSTLMNRLIGAKVSIVSDKPQTTRDCILGILSEEQYQAVFVDTPGLMQPRDKLNQCLLDEALDGLRDADLVLHLVDARDASPFPEGVREAIQGAHARKFLIYNKMDLLPAGAQPAYRVPAGEYEREFSISALDGSGVEAMLDAIVAALPLGPRYYDEDILSDRDERFLTAEIVREKAYHAMGQELPYSIAVETDEFKDRANGKTFIRCILYVERESQKGMLIGKGGAALKDIGREARPEIEELIGRPVYLELWVKVRKNWTKKDHELKRLGYLKLRK